MNRYLDEIKNIIFGLQDGMVSTVVLTTTIATTLHSRYSIIVAVIAAGIGGGISMAAGIYIGSKSQKEIFEKEIDDIDYKDRNIRKLMENYDIDENNIDEFLKDTKKYPTFKKIFFSFLITGENIDRITNPVKDAFFMGTSFLIGAFIPAIAYFVSIGTEGIILSILFTAIILFLVGVIKSIVTSRKALYSGMEIMIIGVLAGIIGYFIGMII
ncbi:VIT1/CCC1 transporter family protein [Patescibacteria group bacterium]|nr:VIT1/CCC1 transporter family protein [Patescibacteria group bacterium]